MSLPTQTQFRKRWFPGASAHDWADWRWQMRHALDTPARVLRIFAPLPEEADMLRGVGPRLPLAVTPYYAALLDPDDPADPIRKTVIPRTEELATAPGECADPLGEEAHAALPGLVHTYRTKALVLVTDHCATYCRYCTRARLVGSGVLPPETARWERAAAYVRGRPEIRDVLLSGGDPLVLSDDRLDRLLSLFRAIPHVELLRIGTKLPAVLPQRFTPALARVLRRHRPLWLSVHFTHPRELTAEARRACLRLSDAGIPLCNQTVLLRGVNDDLATIQQLMEGLLTCNVRPYYLHQCDAIQGAAHFRTPVATGMEIVAQLHGRTTGYAVPTLMLDAPGGGGKVPLTPSFIRRREGRTLVVADAQGNEYRYEDV